MDDIWKNVGEGFGDLNPSSQQNDSMIYKNSVHGFVFVIICKSQI